MYHKINIAKLSKAQIAKLLRGDRIRVKHGEGHSISLSQEQAKKVMSAHKKGKGCCVQFDPYQCDMHRGEGIFDSVKAVAAKVAPTLIQAGADELKKSLGHGKKGKGMVSDLLKKAAPVLKNVGKAVAPALIQAGADELKKSIGSGRKVVAHKGKKVHKKGKKGGALYPAGYASGEGALGGVIGSALGDIFLPF